MHPFHRFHPFLVRYRGMLAHPIAAPWCFVDGRANAGFVRAVGRDDNDGFPAKTGLWWLIMVVVVVVVVPL